MTFPPSWQRYLPRSYFVRHGKDATGREKHKGVEMTGQQQRGTETRGQGVRNYINFDQILLMDGIYQDKKGVFGYEQNLNLAPHGRVIEVIAQNPGNAHIDCDGGEIDALRPFGQSEHHEPDAEQHGSLSFKDVVGRCNGFIRWGGDTVITGDRGLWRRLLT